MFRMIDVDGSDSIDLKEFEQVVYVYVLIRH